MNEYICKSILLILCVSVGSLLTAQAVERNLKGEIDRTDQQRIDVNLKYGSLLVRSHELATIRYEAIITCTGKDADKARELAERVEITVNESYTYIQIDARVSDEKKSRIARFFQQVDPFDNSKIDVQLTIWVPRDIELRADLKYADAVIETDLKRLEIDQSHGYTTAQQIINRMEYTGDFGRLTIDSVADMEANLNFSDLEARRVGRMELTSKGAEVDIGSVDQIEIQSLRDELMISQANQIRSSASMSRSRIDLIVTSAEISVSNGSLEIGAIDESCERVAIDMKRADLRVQTGHNQFSLSMDLDGTEASFPKDLAASLEKEEFPETGRRAITYKGSASPIINISGLNGRCDIFTD